MFILAAQRDDDHVGAFHRYRTYLEENRTRFPKCAHALAISAWYFDFQRHDCPHDAWLEWIRIEEASSGQRHEIRSSAITIRLLGAYHDGNIELHYPRVFEYQFDSPGIEGGHRNWRYDELRVDTQGRLIHEIEWCGARTAATWRIVASDVEFRWMPC